MGKPLTDIMPTLYAGLDMVSREMVGMIPAVTINAAPTTVAKGENVRIPKVASAKAEDIVPGNATTNGDADLDYIDMTVQKSRMVPVKWNGENQLGVSNSGTYNKILADQFAQAMRALVNEVESDLVGLYVAASRACGTPGTTPLENGVKDVAMVRKLLVDNGSPTTDLQLVVDTTAGANLRSNSNLIKANEAGSDQTLRRGVLLDVSGFAIRESAQIRSHIAGSITGSALVNNPDGYPIGATTIAVDGATNIGLKPGDVITLGGLHYVISANATATPLNIAAPGLWAAMADNAPLTVAASYTPCLAFDRAAMQLVARMPAMPQGGDEADDVTPVTDPISGIGFQVAVYRGYRQVRYEIGLAWGVKNIKSEHTVLLLG